MQNAGGYISQVQNGENGFLVDFRDVAAAQSAIVKAANGELSKAEPLRRENLIDPIELVCEYVGQRRNLKKQRLLAVIGRAAATLACSMLWALSLIYEIAVCTKPVKVMPMCTKDSSATKDAVSK